MILTEVPPELGWSQMTTRFFDYAEAGPPEI